MIRTIILSALIALAQSQASCGGIAGLKCPIGHNCVMNCDKTTSDCMGTCEEAMLPTCASMICKADSICVDDIVNGAKCVSLVKPTCATIRCALGYTCKEDDKMRPECVSEKPTCASTACIATSSCKEHPTRGAICVPINLPTCATIDCKGGATCKDDKDFGAECTYNCGGIAGLKCPIGHNCVMNCDKTTSDCMGTCEEAMLPTCASMICKADSICVDDIVNGAKCVSLVKPTCATIRCALGYTCKEDDKMRPECVSEKPTCASTACIATSSCKEHPTRGAICVPTNLPTCATIDCKGGATCKDDKEFGAECTYNCFTKEVWTTEKSKWCCANEKMGCSTPPLPLPTCGGIAGIRCLAGFECLTNCDGITDCMGVCEKISIPAEGKLCKTSSDCAEDEYCRLAQLSSFDCGDQMVCTPRAKEGDSCGGFMNPCNFNVCLSSLKCVYRMIPDAPGTCLKPTLAVGDVCREEDEVLMWEVMDRSSDCPKGTKCVMEESSKKWTCAESMVARCSPMSCGDEEKCVIQDGKVTCVGPKVDNKCDLKMEELVLCGAGSVCKKGYSCTGCQQTCSCDSNGKKVCSKDCRRTCEKIEDKTDCMTESISEWKTLGCKTYSCFGFVKSPSVEEMKYCCEKTGRYCKVHEEEKFNCKSDPKGWLFAQRKWCCEQEEVGCPVSEFDCSVPDDSKQIIMNADGLLQTSVVDVELWDEKKSSYCCKYFQVGCPAEKDLFDCDWSQMTFAPWSEEQSEWCCEVKGMRCPIIEPVIVDEQDLEKCQAKSSERATWDEETRAYCCLFEGAGCATEKYDCYGDSRTVSEWSSEQQEWCCNEENIGCKVDCRAPADLITSELDKQHCCESKGLHCLFVSIEDEEDEEADEMVHKKSFRLSFKGSITKINENPKRFLKKLRRTILRVAKGVKPSGLMIKYIGGLMKDNVIPPQDARQRWGTSFPISWNKKFISEEEQLTRSIATLGHGVSSVSEQKSLGSEGAFVEFSIRDMNELVVDKGSELLGSAVDESRVGGGLLRNNGDGSTMILEPVGKGMDELPENQNKETSKDDSNSVLFIIVGVLTALCMGGTVGLIIYKRRPGRIEHDANNLSLMEEVNSPQPSEDVLF